LNGCDETVFDNTSFVAGLFLSGVYLAVVAGIVPLYAHLLRVCGGGVEKAWSFQGVLVGNEADCTVSPMGRKRI